MVIFMINLSICQQFLNHIIVPAIQTIKLDTLPARQILLGTALQESNIKNIQQEAGGPAQGYFQMEPPTHDDIRNNFLLGHTQLKILVDSLLPVNVVPSHNCLIPYPLYACAMARCLYRRYPEIIPTDTEGQWELYKKRYNTPLGKATREQYMENFAHANGINWEEIPLLGNS